MLPKPYDHQERLRQIHSSEAVAAMVTSPNAQVRELWDQLLRLVAAADPSSFYPAILSWYAPIGRSPKDPYRIMRSLLLMIHLGHGSVREGYLTLHHSPALAALGGWSADESLPAIGTFAPARPAPAVAWSAANSAGSKGPRARQTVSCFGFSPAAASLWY
ncbi:MAG: hypothetical protein M0031_00230 [Thermaerobacter sp.]|jgi:hypothetical protein|nr:hypothetical protein [Thermaerobacter sp.]